MAGEGVAFSVPAAVSVLHILAHCLVYIIYLIRSSLAAEEDGSGAAPRLPLSYVAGFAASSPNLTLASETSGP